MKLVRQLRTLLVIQVLCQGSQCSTGHKSRHVSGCHQTMNRNADAHGVGRKVFGVDCGCISWYDRGETRTTQVRSPSHAPIGRTRRTAFLLEPKWLRKIAWNWGFHWVGNIDQTPKMIPAQTPNMIVGLSISPYLPHFRPSRPSANNR